MSKSTKNALTRSVDYSDAMYVYISVLRVYRLRTFTVMYRWSILYWFYCKRDTTKFMMTMMMMMIYRATLCVSAVLAVDRCLRVCLSVYLSVLLSVCHTGNCIRMAKDITRPFSWLDSPIILVSRSRTL